MVASKCYLFITFQLHPDIHAMQARYRGERKKRDACAHRQVLVANWREERSNLLKYIYLRRNSLMVAHTSAHAQACARSRVDLAVFIFHTQESII